MVDMVDKVDVVDMVDKVDKVYVSDLAFWLLGWHLPKVPMC